MDKKKNNPELDSIRQDILQQKKELKDSLKDKNQSYKERVKELKQREKEINNERGFDLMSILCIVCIVGIWVMVALVLLKMGIIELPFKLPFLS